ncbi:MAG: hypothetical protein KDC53_03525 [Saprospiraceae bacterium]|nr:hypothetical protein [Saprospiraceae bacterium]
MPNKLHQPSIYSLLPLLLLLLFLACRRSNSTVEEYDQFDDIDRSSYSNGYPPYPFDDDYTYQPDSILQLIDRMGLCDDLPVCEYGFSLTEPCHRPDGSHYRCFATKEMAQFYLLDDYDMVMIQYANAGSCGNLITIYQNNRGNYQQVFHTCGVVDSIGSSQTPREVFIWERSGRFVWTWDTLTGKDSYELDSIPENSGY